MQKGSAKPIRLFFLILYFTIILFYLLVCLVPFLDPGRFWFISVLGLLYPFLLILVITSLFVLLIKKSKWFLLSLAALLISWQQVSVLVALHIPNKTEGTSGKTLRVLSWNVSRWTENRRSARGKQENSYRTKMMAVVQKQNADVLCFQEFFECYAPAFFSSNIPVFKKMGYAYHYFSPSSITVNGAFQTGLIIFSKYPIIDSAYFKTVSRGHSEGFSYVDIKFRENVLRIFNTHLESAGFKHRDPGSESYTAIFSKLRRSYSLRRQQADRIRTEMDKSPYPVIFCGDVDDVPNSYVYFKLKGNLQDAFLKKEQEWVQHFNFFRPLFALIISWQTGDSG